VEVKSKNILVKLSPRELEALVEFVAAEANNAEDKSTEKELDRLYDKLADILDGV